METREEFQEQAEGKLEELKPKVWMVKQKADDMKNETRIEYNELFQILNAKLEQVGECLKELEEASDETWQNLRAKVDGALSDLNNSVGNVISRLG
jgi:ElaB/YqjD/DUF883 family membrane-anchored ribosome-binding protein